MSQVNHKTVYEDSSRIAVRLPFTDSLKQFHQDGYFPLVEDPVKNKASTFVGMFVLRPGKESWNSPLNPDTLYEVKGWSYNVKGLDGGWLVANGNVMDAYRLALQYAISDAVLVGSTTVTVEGVPKGDKKGYVWHQYTPASWPHLKEADPNLLEKLNEQRRLLQKQGYLSQRKYPAQIVITQSGKESNPDILEATIFHEKDPEGNPIETYIVTSRVGADRIRERAGKFGLESRINKILIPHSPADNPGVIDLKSLPKKLYQDYNIIIGNHDGGATVLSEFSRSGILPQINLTLMRGQSLYDVLKHTTKVPKTAVEPVLADFNNRATQFFTTENGKMPRELRSMQILTDKDEDAAVIAFDARELRGL